MYGAVLWPIREEASCGKEKFLIHLQFVIWVICRNVINDIKFLFEFIIIATPNSILLLDT